MHILNWNSRSHKGSVLFGGPGHSGVLFSGSLPSLDITGDYRLSLALEIQNFIQPAWLLALVIDTGFLPVLSNEYRESLSETLFAGTKDRPNFSSAEALPEGLLAYDLLVAVFHRVYKCRGTGDFVVLRVSLFPKHWPLMGDVYRAFFERLNPKVLLRWNHKVKASARFCLEMQTPLFSEIWRWKKAFLKPLNMLELPKLNLVEWIFFFKIIGFYLYSIPAVVVVIKISTPDSVCLLLGRTSPNNIN